MLKASPVPVLCDEAESGLVTEPCKTCGSELTPIPETGEASSCDVCSNHRAYHVLGDNSRILFDPGCARCWADTLRAQRQAANLLGINEPIPVAIAPQPICAGPQLEA